MRTRRFGLIATLLAAVLGASVAGAQPADLVVRNASVWTADPANPAATTLGVRDGVLVHVGDDDPALIGPHTTVVDAQGRRVLPGLIDTHVHLGGGAASLDALDLRAASSREDLLAMLQRGSAGLPASAWVLGRGWSAESWPDQRPPTAEEIDWAVGNRPAALVRMDGHSLIASATALRMAGIDAQGPSDPAGGTIGRTASGAPDGALYESAMALVQRLTPARDAARMRELMRRAVAHTNAMGVTQVGAIDARSTIEGLLVPMDESGEMTLRVAATVSESYDTIERWRPVLAWAAANPSPSPRVRVLGFKGYMDGSLGSRTAWMFEPFLDNPDDRGADNAGYPLAMAGSGELGELILIAAEMSLQPAVHAIGDKANATLLDWYAQIPDERRRALRPRIEHAQHMRAADVERFARLGVIPSMQPYHKADDGRYAQQRIGAERSKSSYAFRALLDADAALAFGSDWPVVSVDPLLGIHAAVTARTLDGSTFVPEQSISVEEALVAYTRTAAFALHSEASTGMLRTGMVADFIVLDRDILAINTQDIPDVRVVKTYVGGELVYEAR